MSAKAAPRAALPPWAETLRQKYLAAEASTFVLYRNVFDNFLVGETLHTLQSFLLAELLYEDSRFAEASAEYEKTAYQYPTHAKSADAGYAALLAYAEQEKRAAGSAELAHRAPSFQALHSCQWAQYGRG